LWRNTIPPATINSNNTFHTTTSSSSSAFDCYPLPTASPIALDMTTAAMMYPAFAPQYSSTNTINTQAFIVASEPLPLDAIFAFNPHPFLSAFQAPLPSTSVPEELRCQYSSKRCENRRTNKKSGGLHKFCAVHREKANRNQMRLDHRRRVLKRLAQREQQRNGPPSASSASPHSDSNSPYRHRRSAASRDADGENEYLLKVEDDLEIDLMPLALHSENADRKATQLSSTFDPQDLRILEALLFSDEEQPENEDALRAAAPVVAPSIKKQPAPQKPTEKSETRGAAWTTTWLEL
jgi:hypothetical protein